MPWVNIFNYTNDFRMDVLAFSASLFLPLGSIFAFMFVGIIEEYMKHVVVVKADRGWFRSIDDAIEFSIIAALGFAFIENILYFHTIWQFQGGEVLAVSFVFRSIFSTFAHVLFSGIYGYFYGMAYFADPLWSEKQRKERHPVIQFFHDRFHFKKNRVYAVEKHAEGLFLAVFLHAAFNIMLELNLTFFMIPFLILGYTTLDFLFQKKENLKQLGKLTGVHDHHLHQRLWRKTSFVKFFKRISKA